ncbi:MAG: DUF1499 domain-containing protein [Myxococcota bacterium]
MASVARMVSFVALLLAALGLVAANLGLVAPLVGFATCMGSALLGGLVAAILSLVAIARTRGGRDPIGRQKAWVGLAIGLGLIVSVLAAAASGAGKPPINDVTTDLEDPPAFAPASAVPAYADRDMAYPPAFVETVRAAYPEVRPLVLAVPVDEAYARALAVAEDLGWRVVARNEAEHAFDAQDRSALFRFVDDVAVRIRTEGDGARVDVRSKSRDGRGDLGANAARIERFLDAMR